jgi:hypothetical protein
MGLGLKQFTIQAVCETKSLWEVMQFLESKRCTGILARPLANGAGQGLRAKPNGMSRIDAALAILRQQTKPMRTVELRDVLQGQGFPGQVGSMLHMLLTRKLIRRVGAGKYMATKKGD